MRYLETATDIRRQRVAADITSQLPAGIFNLTIEQTAVILNCHPGHIRNQLSDEVFPIATITLGSRRYIPLSNLIDYLYGLIVPDRPVPKRRRGPRTKVERRMLREQQNHVDSAVRGAE